MTVSPDGSNSDAGSSDAQAAMLIERQRRAERSAHRVKAWPLVAFALMLPPLNLLDEYMAMRRTPLGGGWLWLIIRVGTLLVPVYVIILVTVFAVQRRLMTRTQRASLLMFAIILGLYWIIAGWYQPLAGDLGVRAMISSKLPITELQSWALDLVNSKQDELNRLNAAKRDGERVDYRSILPGALRDLRPNSIRVWRSPDGLDYVHIELGGGFQNYGIIIGPPTLTSEAAPLNHYRWRPGVYGYQE